MANKAERIVTQMLLKAAGRGLNRRTFFKETLCKGFGLFAALSVFSRPAFALCAGGVAYYDIFCSDELSIPGPCPRCPDSICCDDPEYACTSDDLDYVTTCWCSGGCDHMVIACGLASSVMCVCEYDAENCGVSGCEPVCPS
jgi:hypothetical protein